MSCASVRPVWVQFERHVVARRAFGGLGHAGRDRRIDVQSIDYFDARLSRGGMVLRVFATAMHVTSNHRPHRVRLLCFSNGRRKVIVAPIAALRFEVATPKSRSVCCRARSDRCVPTIRCRRREL